MFTPTTSWQVANLPAVGKLALFIPTSRRLAGAGASKGIAPIHIQPGRPMQNAYIERCNGSIRRELLNAYQFDTLTEVTTMVENYMIDYNQHRPHQALGYLTPF